MHRFTTIEKPTRLIQDTTFEKLEDYAPFVSAGVLYTKLPRELVDHLGQNAIQVGKGTRAPIEKSQVVLPVRINIKISYLLEGEK